MKKSTKRKNTKKLSALLLLLFLTVVMLATTTYAWFTANRTVKIESIDVNVAASSGLQISTDAVNWKTVVLKDDITAPTAWTGHKNQLPATLAPVSTVGALDADDSNYMEMFLGTVDATSGEFLLTSSREKAVKGTEGHYVAFDIFLKADLSDTEMAENPDGIPVYLTSDANVDSKGTDTGLKNASRVAFVKQGEASATEALNTIQNLANGENVIIWEPNSGSHTGNGIVNASTYYSKLLVDNSDPDNVVDLISPLTASDANAKLPYQGVKAAFDTGIKLNTTNKVDNADLFDDVTTVDTKATHEAIELFKIKKGITKYRIYLWVEGQDVDCENNASGHDISFNISLSLDND